jgi:hypothetical protein
MGTGPKIGSKQYTINAAGFDHGPKGDRAWAHRIHIDIRLEVLRRPAQVLVYLFDRWVLDALVVQLPVPIESANQRGKRSSHMNEENLEEVSWTGWCGPQI